MIDDAQHRLTELALKWGSAAACLAFLVWTLGPETSRVAQLGCLAMGLVFAGSWFLLRAGWSRASRAMAVVIVPVVCVPAVSRFWGIDGHLGLLLLVPVLWAGLLTGPRGVAVSTLGAVAYVGAEWAWGPAPWSMSVERAPARLERAQDLAVLLAVTGILVGLLVHHYRSFLDDALLRERQARASTARQSQLEARQRTAMHAAEAASRAKSAFLASMSHELRTPLNAILGYGEMLEEDLQDPQSRADLQRILTSGRYLLTLIDEVLDMSRVEAGSLEVAIRPVELGGLMTDVRDAVAPAAADAGITMEVPDDPGLAQVAVLTDRRRARQVLLNLLSNGVKFARSGVGVAVRVGPDVVDLDVWDDGDGVPPDLEGRLFEPFARGSNSAAGTGLGLALSRELARRMGGDLRQVPTNGPGARFRFQIPRSTAPVPTDPSEVEP